MSKDNFKARKIQSGPQWSWQQHQNVFWKRHTAALVSRGYKPRVIGPLMFVWVTTECFVTDLSQRRSWASLRYYPCFFFFFFKWKICLSTYSHTQKSESLSIQCSVLKKNCCESLSILLHHIFKIPHSSLWKSHGKKNENDKSFQFLKLFIKKQNKIKTYTSFHQFTGKVPYNLNRKWINIYKLYIQVVINTT